MSSKTYTFNINYLQLYEISVTIGKLFVPLVYETMPKRLLLSYVSYLRLLFEK